jgi:hypothetical protein
MNRPLRLAAATAMLTAAIALCCAADAEPPAGSKNFAVPPAVPNYFSNESGPVMRTPAPLPIAPPVTSTAPLASPPPAAEIERKPERRIITVVIPRSRIRVAHASAGTAGGRKTVAGRGRSGRVAGVAAHSDRLRTARLAHAELHTAKTRPVTARGSHAGRG